MKTTITNEHGTFQVVHDTTKIKTYVSVQDAVKMFVEQQSLPEGIEVRSVDLHKLREAEQTRESCDKAADRYMFADNNVKDKILVALFAIGIFMIVCKVYDGLSGAPSLYNSYKHDAKIEEANTALAVAKRRYEQGDLFGAIAANAASVSAEIEAEKYKKKR